MRSRPPSRTTTSASHLRLHDNTLTGPIPHTTGPSTYCNALHLLYLAANCISGSFSSPSHPTSLSCSAALPRRSSNMLVVLERRPSAN
ncbi:hypothetical protein GUJ93_ZPchr0010g9615 [Zizania palustris]|uniref:Uncharacterized protein n=1 Tax=Zizania palustris TaxID=103762 RepID=A0A8J5W8E8_ZIZPA|nr:hypothetical protein GUJ93_ZPchr0010g9615 [Zizania palustris]